MGRVIVVVVKVVVVVVVVVAVGAGQGRLPITRVQGTYAYRFKRKKEHLPCIPNTDTRYSGSAQTLHIRKQHEK
jgi:hypothetical protein